MKASKSFKLITIQVWLLNSFLERFLILLGSLQILQCKNFLLKRIFLKDRRELEDFASEELQCKLNLCKWNFYGNLSAYGKSGLSNKLFVHKGFL